MSNFDDRNIFFKCLRGSNHHEIIDCSKGLPHRMLPTLGNVLRHGFVLREENSTANKSKPKDMVEVLTTIAKDIKALWIKASIPQVINEKSIRNKVQRSMEIYQHH